jgi:hypothetical protein
VIEQCFPISFLNTKQYFSVYQVIEYQHRGLPHAHIVARLTSHPETLQEKLDFIGEHIQAKFSLSQPNEDLVLHDKYNQLIKDTMIHRCAQAVNGCLDKQGMCRRGYMTRPCCNYDSIDERGTPQ